MPTNNPVPSSDPSDLVFNASKLDEVVNSAALTFTDRLGIERNTVAGSLSVIDAARDLALAEIDADVQAIGGVVDWSNTYQGGKASAPAVRNNGAPLQNGDIYFNTGTGRMMAFASGVWYATEAEGETDAALVSFQPPGAGAVATDVQGKLREISVTPQDYMTAEQKMNVFLRLATVDVSGALSKALDYAIDNGCGIKAPGGRYLISQKITKTLGGYKSISLAGDGENVTVFELNTGGDGLEFNLTGNYWFAVSPGSTGIHFESLSFATTNTNSGVGVGIYGASVAGRPGAKVSFSKVDWRAVNSFGQFWLTGCKIVDCQNVWIDECRFIIGGPSNTTANGLDISGSSLASSPTIAYINNCEFIYGATQLNIGNFVEGVYLTQATMIGGNKAVKQTPSTGESGLHVMGGHFSSKLYNFELTNLFDLEIIGALLYRTGATANHNSIRLQDCGRFTISGNVFKGTNVADEEVAVNVNATVNNEQFGGYIGGNSFHLWGARAVWLGANANYVHVGENVYRQCAVRVLNQSTNASNTITPKIYCVTVARVLTGGATTETINLTIPAGAFRIKPGAALVTVDSGSAMQVSAFYDFTASTEANAVVIVRNPAGGNVAAGTHRFNVVLFEQAYSSAF